jgi:hypothetical protein
VKLWQVLPEKSNADVEISQKEMGGSALGLLG